jgi:hypothetical protein
MKQLIINTENFILLFLTLVVLNSCKVTFIPSYDAKISEHIEKTSKVVDKFYLSMLETTFSSNNGRAFSEFSDQYVNIEVELNSLLNKNKLRPLNENSIRICVITIELWKKHKEEHKRDNTLSNGLIKLNRTTFDDLLFAMQKAEKALEIIDSH